MTLMHHQETHIKSL